MGRRESAKKKDSVKDIEVWKKLDGDRKRTCVNQHISIITVT